MSIVVFTADHHIRLGQKGVPKDWQRNRFYMLAEELNNIQCDYHIFGGDLLDVSNPSIEEVGLMYTFLSKIQKPIIMISGNHELYNKTKDCYRYITDMLQDLKVRLVTGFENIDGIDYIPYNILKQKDWYKGATPASLAVTHVRGEVPPHVQPEIDLERFKHYDKVFAGDLHSTTNSQANILYPGSPFGTTFHRSILSGSNGYFIINTVTGIHEWHELYLPQLVRATVTCKEEIKPTDYHHTIYEVTGSIEELALLEDSELLDKKVAQDISTPAALNMKGDMAEELAEFLVEVRDIPKEDIHHYIGLFREVVNDND